MSGTARRPWFALLAVVTLLLAAVVESDRSTPRAADAAQSVPQSFDAGQVDGVVAFSCVVDDRYQICAARPSTGERWQLTAGSTNHSDPSWSPDGTQIVAAAWSNDLGINLFTPWNAELVLIDVTDLDDVGAPVSTGIRGFMPAWSPHGDLVAFSAYVTGAGFHNRAPIVTRLAEYSNGSLRDVGVISPESGQWIDPAWNPDGDRVVTTFRRGQPFDSMTPAWAELFTVASAPVGVRSEDNLVVGHLQRNEIVAVRQQQRGLVEGSYSPDGTSIVYVACAVLSLTGGCASNSRRLAVMDARGLGTSAPSDLTDAGELAREPVWSPDGSHIAYGSADGIRLYSTTTGASGLLTGTTPWDAQSAWQPEPTANREVVAVDGSGRARTSFTEVEPVFAAVDVPLQLPLSVCLVEAGLVSPGALDEARCAVGNAPGAIAIRTALAQGEPLTLEFDTLPPGRYRLLASFALPGDVLGGFAAKYLSDPFSVTCFGGSCFTVPVLGIAGDLLAFADRMDALATVLAHACAVANLALAIQGTMSILRGGIRGLGFVIGYEVGSRVADALMPMKPERDFVSGRFDALYGVLTSPFEDERAKSGLASIDPSAGEIPSAIHEALFDKAQETEAAKRSGIRRIGSAYAKSIALGAAIDLACNVIVGVHVQLADMAREAAQLITELASGGGGAVGALGGRVGSTEPVDGRAELHPADESTTLGLQGLTATLPTIEHLAEQLDELIGASDQEFVDLIGGVARGFDGVGSWAHLLGPLGDEVVRIALENGRDPAEPAIPSAVIDGLTTLQAQVAASGLGDVGRSLYPDVDVAEEYVDVLTDELLSADFGSLPTDSSDALAAALRTASDELVEQASSLSRDLRLLRASLSSAPWVDDLHVVTEIGRAIALDLPAFDPTGGFVDVEIVDVASHGTVTSFGRRAVYSPSAGFVGTDSFTFRATADGVPSSVRTVTVDVRLPAPQANPDEYGVRQGTELVVPAPGVLTNDSSPRIPLVAALVTQPSGGVVTLEPDGSFRFVPGLDVTGEQYFTYSASYPGSAPSTPVRVTIDVIASQSPPVAVRDVLTTLEDVPVEFQPLANDFDPDGDVLTLLGVSRPSQGRVACASSSCTYTPHPDTNGSDTFSYRVMDETGRTSIGIVDVTIVPVDDPPRPADDVMVFEAGEPVTLNVLANDVHPDGIGFELVSNTDPSQGTLVCSSDGNCTYTPDDAMVVADSASYTVEDERGATATANITMRTARAFEEIEAAGPLEYIVTGASLSCAVDYAGDALGAFFAEFGCGTFLAVGDELFGPDRVAGSANPPQPRTTFTQLGQSDVAGAGTLADPYSITTDVGAGSTGLRIRQRDLYVDGEESYLTELDVTNVSSEPRSVTVYRAGDCVVADDDGGFAALDLTTGVATCLSPDDDGRLIEWIPVTGGSEAFAGDADDLWATIAGRTGLGDACECDAVDPFDHGAGLSWTIDLAPGETRTLAHRTSFAPFAYSPVTLQMVADEPVSSTRSRNGYTVALTNPITTTPVVVDEVVVELPPDFLHTPGTTAGAVVVDPSTLDGLLRWTGPLEIPAGDSVVFRFDVETSPSAGTYLAAADAASAAVATVGTGPTAPIEVISNLSPVSKPDVEMVNLAATLDGSESFDADGDVVAWEWDLGDGTVVAGETAAHTYATPGTYEVELTVTDDLGATGVASVEVEALDPNLSPVADAVVSPVVPPLPEVESLSLLAEDPPPLYVGAPLLFDGTESFDPDGEIVSWTWDFGDGTEGAGPTVVHTYDAPGPYSVVLTVVDDRGATGSVTIEIDVVEPENLPPIAAFVASAVGLEATFDGTESLDPDGASGLPVTWEWDFGDGSTGSGPTPVHTYATEGVYDVTLTVTDDRGATDSVTRTVGVGSFANQPPVADAEVSGAALAVEFDGSGSFDPDGVIESYEWDFGDESFGEGLDPEHVYDEPGTYLVQLLVTDDDGAIGFTVLEVVVPLDDDSGDTTTTSTLLPTTTTTTILPTTTTTTTTTILPTTTTTTTSTTTTTTILPTTTTSTTILPTTTTSTTILPTTTSSTTTTTSPPTTPPATTSPPTTPPATTSPTTTTSTTTTLSTVATPPTTSLPDALAPVAPTEPPPDVFEPVIELPATGRDPLGTLRLMLQLLVIGAALVLVSRRRRHEPSD